MDTERKLPSSTERARNNLIMTLHFNKKLTDDFLPTEQFNQMMTKTFSEWPEELQKKLQPFGAATIQ